MCKARQDKDPTAYAVRRQKYNLKSKYGITPDQFNELLDAQGGKCACCGTTEPHGRANRFCVDHCHTTGKMRGLLCSTCNTGLGKLGDNIEGLKRALAYLEKTQ